MKTEIETVTEPINGVQTNKKKGITGSTLKLIAIVTMFIDHFAAIVLERYLFQSFFKELDGVLTYDPADTTGMLIYGIYQILRYIGRLAFPIFCFLMIEGFRHTRSKLKYFLRLMAFALISEIPFDFGFTMSDDNQNVFFTLAIGLVVIWSIDEVLKTIDQRKQSKNKLVLRIIAVVVISILGSVLAEILKTDYASTGILTIVAIYLVYQKTKSQAGSVAAGCGVLTLSMLNEFTAFAIVPLVANYNGERGWKLKYIFYLFYPLHILLLHLICLGMGI